jgi:hypothetical protein
MGKEFSLEENLRKGAIQPRPEGLGFLASKDKSYECWQPDIYDDLEYNLILATPQGIVKVKSIDFDFEEEKIES